MGGGGGWGLGHPLSLKLQGQLCLIPKIIETVIPQITYIWNLTIGGNFKALSDPLDKAGRYLLPGWGDLGDFRLKTVTFS